MRRRRLGLQKRWAHVINSLQKIIPSYEKASNRISLDRAESMRREAVSLVTSPGLLVLDLGSGPGSMSRLIASRGGNPVLLDVSGPMLSNAPFEARVRGVFEYLPFRDSAFDSVVSGFALRDSYDLAIALSEVNRVLKRAGRFGFCDLGKPDSKVKSLLLALYLMTVPPVIGLIQSGRAGLGYGTLFHTYILAPANSSLKKILLHYFEDVSISESRLGSSIIGACTAPS